MLEQNVFRTMMLISSIAAVAVLVGMFLWYPAVDVTPGSDFETDYLQVMNISDESWDNSWGGSDDRYITMYESVQYWIQARTKGRIQKY